MRSSRSAAARRRHETMSKAGSGNIPALPADRLFNSWTGLSHDRLAVRSHKVFALGSQTQASHVHALLRAVLHG